MAMTRDQIDRRCAHAASSLIARGFIEPGPLNDARVLELVNRAVRLGLHLGLNAAEKAIEQKPTCR